MTGLEIAGALKLGRAAPGGPPLPGPLDAADQDEARGVWWLKRDPLLSTL